MEKEKIVESYILESANHGDLGDVWSGLTKRLAKFGFDRILFGAREDTTRESMRNHANSIILSTYGAEIDAKFLNGRMYLESPTLKMAYESAGVISWEKTHERYRAGTLSDAEAEVFMATQKLGLTAGYTYAPPDRGTGYRSCFGLAFKKGEPQAEANAAWDAHSGDIVQLLLIFDLAAARLRSAPDNQMLPAASVELLKLVAEGRTVGEIAELQGKHRRTIEDQLSRIRDTLGTSNTLQAVNIARQQGQI